MESKPVKTPKNISNSNNPNIKQNQNNFLQDLKKLTTSSNKNQINSIKNTPNNIELRKKLNSKLESFNQNPNMYVNEVMQSELKNLSRENLELKFCLDKLNQRFEKELKFLKNESLAKTKEINSSKEIIKKNIALIELLGNKISNYEKIFKEMQQNSDKKKNDKDVHEKMIILENENNKLKSEIKSYDEVMKNFKDDMASKKEIFMEIETMKIDMEKYLKTMDNLYQEIGDKDEQIIQLKKQLDTMTKNPPELNNINYIDNKGNNNSDLNKELEKSKLKQKNLENELNEVKKNYESAKEYNIKMQNLTKEASDMVKNSIDSREKMKQEYDKAINELVEKYEKQIQFMKLVIVEQNEKYEKELEDLKNKQNENKDNAQDNNNKEEKKEAIKDEKEEEEKNRYLEKLKKDNAMLLEQNSELKKMNDILVSKMKELPDLNTRFNELFETVKLLKEENDFLKNSMKDTKIMQLLQLEQEKENEEDIEEKEKENSKDNNINNINNKKEDENKLTPEELIVLESIMKDIENGEDQKGDYDMNKLLMLENILKKLDNQKTEENIDDNENKDKPDKNMEEKNNINDNNNINKNDINEEDINLPLKKPENDNNNININSNEKVSNNNNQILYNKKLPNSITKKTENNVDKKKILNSVKKNLNPSSKKENNKSIEESNEEEDEETTPNQINENFNLYKPTKEGMLSFNLSKKIYSTIIPKNYDEFLQVFDPETSVQYNTLEGLFIIPSNKSTQLFYYSSLKNTISDLFNLSSNHSGGCLFLDNSSKNIIAMGGQNSKKVEKFSFETGKLEQLPELPFFISKMTCTQIGNKLYSFFGESQEEKNSSKILVLDMDKNEDGWQEIEYQNDADFNVLTGMSCTNLNDKELLFIGGVIDNKAPNEKLIYFNLDDQKLIKLDKSLPESKIKKYEFTQNTAFNLFINGDIITYGNIDNNNHVHMFDNELHYDLYLTPDEM